MTSSKILMALLLILNVCHGLYLNDQVPEDVLTQSLEATRDVLKSSGSLDCTVAVVSDGSINSTTYAKFSEHLGSNVILANIEIRSQDRGQENAFKNLDVLFQIQKSSRCTVVVSPSNNMKFQSAVLSYAFHRHLLVWPTRVVAITGMGIIGLQNLAGVLSYVNGIVIVNEASHKRCDIYLYQPYSFKVVKIASWTPEKRFGQTPDVVLFPDKFNRFSDPPNMMIAGDEYPPHMAVQVIHDAKEGQQPFVFSGPMVYVLEILAVSMNFTYTLHRSIDGSWGYRRPNGSWTGMVGMLHRKEIDFALGPFGVTYPRAQAIDYSLPLLFDYARITARQGDTEIDMWGFLMPFGRFVWLSIFATMVIIALIAIAFSYPYASKRKLSPESSVFNFVRIFLQQDVLKVPESLAERMLTGLWLLTVVVLFRSYSGNLMSQLAVRYIPQPYQSLGDVVEEDKVSMIWEANTAYVQHFLSATSGILKEVADSGKRGMIKYIPSMQYYSSLDTLVMQGDHVFIVEDLSLQMLLAKHFSEKGSCHFYLSSERFLPLSFAMAVQKKSPLRHPIDERLWSITESGLYNFWLRNAIPNSTSCANVPDKTLVQDSFSLKNVVGIFLILAGGIIVGVLALMVEWIIFWTYQ